MRSVGVKVIHVCLSLAKIIASIVLITVSRKHCTAPLDLYLGLMIIHDMMNIIYCYLEICLWNISGSLPGANANGRGNQADNNQTDRGVIFISLCKNYLVFY